MKILISLLFLLTLFGCTHSVEKDSTVTRLESENDTLLINEAPLKLDNEIEKIEEVKSIGLSSDFLKLKYKNLQSEFFGKIDSIRTVQYPNNHQEISIMDDMTPEYLNKFLADINLDSLSKNNQFEQEYHFNIAPEDFTDPDICKDKIEVSFNDKDGSFRLSIYNTFLVELDWCTESMVIYGFSIKEDKIINFWREEAG